MSNHFVTVCEYGYTHGTCRCPSKDKTVRLIKCNNLVHAQNPKIESRTAEDDKHVLMEALNEIFKASNNLTLGNANSVDDYLMRAHEAAESIKNNYDAAQRALWPDDNRRGYRSC